MNQALNNATPSSSSSSSYNSNGNAHNDAGAAASKAQAAMQSIVVAADGAFIGAPYDGDASDAVETSASDGENTSDAALAARRKCAKNKRRALRQKMRELADKLNNAMEDRADLVKEEPGGKRRKFERDPQWQGAANRVLQRMELAVGSALQALEAHYERVDQAASTTEERRIDVEECTAGERLAADDQKVDAQQQLQAAIAASADHLEVARALHKETARLVDELHLQQRQLRKQKEFGHSVHAADRPYAPSPPFPDAAAAATLLRAAGGNSRALPTVTKFRRTAKGDEAPRSDPLYDAARFIEHLERKLVSAGFSVEQNIGRLLEQSLPGDASSKWAYDLFLNESAEARRTRKKMMADLHTPTMRAFVATAFTNKFYVADLGIDATGAVRNYAWDETKTVETNMDSLAAAATVSLKDPDGDVVLDKLLAALPAYYRDDLLKYAVDKGKQLSFAISQQVLQRLETLKARQASYAPAAPAPRRDARKSPVGEINEVNLSGGLISRFSLCVSEDKSPKDRRGEGSGLGKDANKQAKAWGKNKTLTQR